MLLDRMFLDLVFISAFRACRTCKIERSSRMVLSIGDVVNSNQFKGEFIMQGSLRGNPRQTVFDHVVSGRIFMPGVGYLEMVFVANALNLSSGTTRLENVLFVSPWVLVAGSDGQE